MGKWDTKERLTALLEHLVAYPSVTGSPEEIAICEYLYHSLEQLDYFRRHPEHLRLHPTPCGRKLLTALVKNGDRKKTVLLLSHFDVVGTDDFGELKNVAFRSRQLTQRIKENLENLPDPVRHDLQNEQQDWLFGRGVMDMKAGIALHLAMIERAAKGEFPGHLMLVSVPDEEVHSLGMREAVTVLNELKREHDLHYVACLNSEPSFSEAGGSRFTVYSGSIGKILPGFFCYGKETHVGEPFSGWNASWMAAEVTRHFELHPAFSESVDNRSTPPPTNLMLKDLKDAYSTQIPHEAVTNFNFMVLENPLSVLHRKLLTETKEIAKEMSVRRAERMKRANRTDPKDVRVFSYEELRSYAFRQFGEEEIERRRVYISGRFKSLGPRDLSARLVADLCGLCKHLAPMIVLFYNPPYYPPVSSRNNAVLQKVVERLQKQAREMTGVPLVHEPFFPGLSDLSFFGFSGTDEETAPIMDSMPLFGKEYRLPFTGMRQLDIPVMNLGPYGKDAHRWTERLELNDSFVRLPGLLALAIEWWLKES